MLSLKFLFAKFMSKIQVPSIKNCRIDPKAKVFERCVLTKVEIGRYSYIGKGTKITDAKIGQFCSISGQCDFGGGEHPISHVSTSPVFLKGKSPVGVNFAAHDGGDSKTVTIGNDVWIGSYVYIKGGVKIGDGAIIGAHAVVTHDVAPYSIVAGVPAKELRKRFSDDVIAKLESLSWWNWSDEKLKQYGHLFDDPEQLIREVEKQ